MDESEIVEQIMAHAKSTGNPHLIKLLAEGLKKLDCGYRIAHPKRSSFRVIAGGLKEPPLRQNHPAKKIGALAKLSLT